MNKMLKKNPIVEELKILILWNDWAMNYYKIYAEEIVLNELYKDGDPFKIRTSIFVMAL